MPASVFDPRVALPESGNAHSRHTTTPTTAWESSALIVVEAPAALGEGQSGLGESVMTAPPGPSSPVAEHAAKVRTHVRGLTLVVLTVTVVAGLTVAAALRPGLLDEAGPRTQAAVAAAGSSVLVINLLLWRAWSVPRAHVDGQRLTDLCRLAVAEILSRQLRTVVSLLVPAAVIVAAALWLGLTVARWVALPAAAFAAAGVLWCSVLIGIATRIHIPESKAAAVLGAVMDARTDPAFYDHRAPELEEMTWDEALAMYVDEDEDEGEIA